MGPSELPVSTTLAPEWRTQQNLYPTCFPQEASTSTVLRAVGPWRRPSPQQWLIGLFLLRRMFSTLSVDMMSVSNW